MYYRIQTFEIVEQSNFRVYVDKMTRLLKGIGLWNNEIEEAFSEFTWAVEDDGRVLSPFCSARRYYQTSYIDIPPICPFFIFITPYLHPYVKHNWVLIEFLFEVQNLRDPNKNNFYPATYPLIRQITSLIWQEFKTCGIYFIDDDIEDEDWDRVRLEQPTEEWNFDYAIIPNHLKALYKNCPKTHQIKQHDDYFEAWYTGAGRWQDPKLW